MKKHMMKTNQKWQARWRYITRAAEMFATYFGMCMASGRLMFSASDQHDICVWRLVQLNQTSRHMKQCCC